MAFRARQEQLANAVGESKSPKSQTILSVIVCPDRRRASKNPTFHLPRHNVKSYPNNYEVSRFLVDGLSLVSMTIIHEQAHDLMQYKLELGDFTEASI